MEKRSSPLTVMLEPSLHQTLKDNYNNVSVFVHDLITAHLEAHGIAVPLMPSVPASMRPTGTDTTANVQAHDTLACALCGNDIPSDLVWNLTAWECIDKPMCLMNKHIKNRL